MKNILDKYKELTFTIEDDIYDIEEVVYQYDILKSYFNGEVSKEDVISTLSNSCDCPEVIKVKENECRNMSCKECWEKVLDYKEL